MRRPGDAVGAPERARGRSSLPALGLGTAFGGAMLVCLAANAWVIRSTAGGVHSRAQEVPARRHGVVLGASERTRSGAPNRHFLARIRAATELHRAGRVQTLVVCGGPLEVAEMRAALIARGVPARCIEEDPRGVSTLQSLRHASDACGRRVTIVGERFHAHRSLFLARHLGMDAVAFAKSRPARPARMLLAAVRHRAVPAGCREWAARVKAVLLVAAGRVRPARPA